MATTITAEGVTFIYVGQSETREGLALAGADQPAWDPEKAAEILERPDVRLAHFKSVFRPWVPYFLVWATPRDLDAIDARVAAGAHADDDFVDSIRTRFHVTRCNRSCGAAFDTLAREPGDP